MAGFTMAPLTMNRPQLSLADTGLMTPCVRVATLAGLLRLRSLQVISTATVWDGAQCQRGWQVWGWPVRLCGGCVVIVSLPNGIDTGLVWTDNVDSLSRVKIRAKNRPVRRE